ncbi:conserved protein of unknown function [Methylorubrum extorquens DM4]|jgi:hypothetical protein|uniref:DUF5983 domain-containing protein n=1 Tax=Methylorubrum extorquens (strain DSM 6343 / CIP 106787 / DM4) TaxID=661410 RepID=C7CEF1_METED|nr:hypothetical protein [Methylorubrum extorquens]CAX24287.1 conserved protein of unknown function [Methylorubrum extorquens DM4]
MSNPDVRNFVVVSTAHLTEPTARCLDRTPANQWPCLGGPYGEYGWFVYAHDENSHAGPDPIPDDLFGVMTWGRKHGFDYILFDCDGDLIEDLSSHDW